MKRRIIVADKGRSEKDFFGNGYTHYDSNGKKIGRSERQLFGDTKWFKALWKKPLDKMVRNLKSKGVSDSPYNR